MLVLFLRLVAVVRDAFEIVSSLSPRIDRRGGDVGSGLGALETCGQKRKEAPHAKRKVKSEVSDHVPNLKHRRESFMRL